MSDDDPRLVPGDPLDAGKGRRVAGPGRDAFGNPLPEGSSATQPAAGEPAPAPAYGPGAGFAPPAQPLPPVPSPAPVGHSPAPTYPPPPAGAWQPAASPTAVGGHTLASWGSRAAAATLNFVFRALSLVPAIVAFVLKLNALGAVLLVLALVWIYFLYAPLFMMRAGERNGQTPGKQIMGIRVVRENGEPFGYGWSLLRELVIKDLLFQEVGGFFLLPTLLDYLWPLWDEQNRALHDMVASTRVVLA